MKKSLAIMQPYFMPYIGYFQLIFSVDEFVIYDDVGYIKQGYINRNMILTSGQRKMFSIPVVNQSSYRKINEHTFDGFDKFLKTIKNNYIKAPYFKIIYELLEVELVCNEYNVAIINSSLIKSILKYLGVNKKIINSSEMSIGSDLKGQERVLAICKSRSVNTYINAIGGYELYSSSAFNAHGIDLKFIKSKNIEYRQFGGEFVPWLSIIDVLMFNSPEFIKSEILPAYELIGGSE